MFVPLGEGITLSIAALLVSFPKEFETMQRKLEPLSLCAVWGVVYDVFVALEMFAPFFCH